MTTSFAAFVRTVRQTPLRELWRLPVVRQLWRYGLVGLSQNAIGYGLYLLVTWLGLPPKTAVSILYVVGVLISFFGNRRFTFAHAGSVRWAMVRFFVAHCGGYLLNILLLLVFVDHLGYPHQLIQAASIFVVAGYLFFALKFFVFPRPKAA